MLIEYYLVPCGQLYNSIYAIVYSSAISWHVYIGPDDLPAHELEDRKNKYVYQHIKRGTVC